ncbi:MAG: hypothetical protein M3O67_04265 [Bacteroidota bacterium]|nr:hypothetical protein [Bacteroidota bacterium]
MPDFVSSPGEMFDEVTGTAAVCVVVCNTFLFLRLTTAATRKLSRERKYQMVKSTVIFMPVVSGSFRLHPLHAFLHQPLMQ